MPDSFMPDVQVEIAFNAGYNTPAASRTWTDVSAYVELDRMLDITVGRQDERSTADANQLTLTLDNSDGRFTAQRTASPYYPNVKIGRPIRVRVTPPSGTTTTRFVGFVNEWPVEWDGSDAYARATIRASSRLSRLGLSATLRSVPEQEILGDNPIAYWTMGDPSGSTTATEVSGRGLVGSMYENLYPGTARVTFGSAIGSPVDGLTAVTYPADAASPLEASLNGRTVGTLRLAFLADDDLGSTQVIRAEGPSGRFWIVVNGSAQNYAVAVSDGVTFLVPACGYAAPGVLHDLALTMSSTGGARLYLDGTLIGTGTGDDYTSMTLLRLGPLSQATSHATTFAHVAVYENVLTPAQIADQATAVLNGFRGERTDQRLVRVLNWAGVPASEVAAEVGAQTMTYQVTDGSSAVDVLREVESTEGGVLFDGRDGNVIFHNRSRRYLATAAATLNMASQHVEANYQPKLDRSTLVNDAIAENPTSKESARAGDSASRAEYGIGAQSVKVAGDTYDSLQQAASWLVASYAEPRIRVPALSVDVLAHQGLTPSAQTLLGLTVGDLLAVSNAPAQADSTSPRYFVEGYSESIGPQSYSITYNLSPSYPHLNTFVLDSASRGVLDASNVLAL